MKTTNLEGEKFDESMLGETPISDFYRDSTILITGGTGFVGKVLTEKLLRAFNVRKIYMLIRVKDNLNVKQRLGLYLQESIFDNIRKENNSLFDKVHPIHADFGAVDLDLDESDRQLLIENVEIVFNVVASVKFNEKLSDAIGINVLGTKKILDLTMNMKSLKSFLHISTLYCNCNRKDIDEKVYQPEIGYEQIIQMYRVLDDETLEKLRHCLIGDMPNTYTMTKNCAENLVNHRAYYLPAGIFRPPIVMSTYQEPFPGWTDNLYGPSGVCVWSARGFVRCIYGDPSKKANLVPADFCVNAIIACAYDAAKRYKVRITETTEIPVYNYIFERNNLTWGQYMHLSRKGFHEPFDKSLWCYAYIIIPSKPLHRILTFLLHNIPGYILDLIAMATGQKRIYTRSYRKIGKVIDMMSWFGLREWKFTNQNLLRVDSQLTANERNLLQFNIATIDWGQYFRNYLSGIRRYFFKDNEVSHDKLDRRRKNYRRLYFLHVLLKSSVGFMLMVSVFKFYLRFLKILPKFVL